MIISENKLEAVNVETKVKTRKESQGRRRTVQHRTYTLELDDGSKALYLGDGYFKKRDTLVTATRLRGDGKKLIIAYKNITQKEQGPTEKELRGSWVLTIFLFVFGLGATLVGVSQNANVALLLGAGILLFALSTAWPTIQSLTALRRINMHLSDRDTRG